MREIILALLIFSFLNVIRTDEHFTLVGSRTIQHGSRYSIFVDPSKLEGDAAVIMKLTGEKDEYYKIRANEAEELQQDPHMLNFNLKEKNLANEYKLSILSFRNNKCANDEIPIFPIRKGYSVFIQLDKPLYKPKSSGRFRVILIDQNTKPFKPDKIYVKLTEATGEIVREFRVSGNDINMGIYENVFDIAEEPNLGTWIISVIVNDHTDEVITKSFEVKEYVLPLLNVNIDTNSYLLHTDTLLRLTVSAKYSFGIIARGNADVTAKVYDSQKIVKNTMTKKVSIETKKTVDFDLIKDLKINSNDPDLLIEIIVDFTDELTGKKFQKIKEISLKQKNSFHIKIYNPNTFTPGDRYEFYVSIKDKDGIPQITKSYPVTMNSQYTNSKNNLEVVQPSFLDNGFAKFTWIVPFDVKGMKITVNYRDSSKTFEVSPGDDTKNENFEVSIATKEPSLKELLAVQLKAVNKIGIVNYVVTGRFGVAAGGKFNCQRKESCDFSFKTNDKMVPEANLMIYFVNSDGSFVHDTTKIRFKELSSNFLDIKVPKKTVLPGSNVNLNIASSPNSLVALLGIDESLTYLKTGNDIDKSDVSKDLLTYGHTDFLITLPQVKIIENSFIYYQNFANFRACTEEELELLNLIDARFGEDAEIENRFQKEDNENIELDYGTIPENPEDEDPDEPRVRRDFREIFIFDSVNVDQDGKANFQTQLPDTITTWLITGFAMNQQNGFALAEPTQITTIKQLFMKLHLPYSIKFGEVLRVEATVFSFVSIRNPIKVDITMVSSDEEEQYFEFIEFVNSQPRSIPEDEMTNSLSVTQNSAKSTFFHIRPLKSGVIKILVKAKSSKGNDAVEHTLIVEHEGTTYYETQNVEIDLKQENEFNKQIKFETSPEMIPNSVKFYSTVTSTVIPIPPVQRSKAGQDFFENLIPRPWDCREQRFTKLSINVQVYKFLKARNLLTPELSSNAIDYITTTYQGVLKYRRASDGSFPLWDSEADHVWMTAYVATLFGQIKFEKITHVNNDLIINALDYLASKQGKSGGYEKYNSISQKYLQSKIKPQGVVMTAFVLIAFLENVHLTGTKHQELINQGLRYINENVASANSNYANAISAYAFALAERNDDARRLLTTLNNNAITQDNYKFWNDQGRSCNEDSEYMCVEITSYALLALAQLERLDEAIPLESWLISKQSIYGTNGPTHCTVLSLKALAEIGKFDKIEVFDTNVEIKTNTNEIRNFKIDGKKLNGSPVVTLKPETRLVTISAQKTKGSGKCHASIEFQYTRREANVTRNFDLDVEILSKDNHQVTIKVCAKFVSDGDILQTAMTLMEIETPSGYVVDKDNNLSDQNLARFQKMELKNQATTAVLYFDSFTTTSVCPTLKLIKLNEVSDKKKSSVKIYDYYTLKYRATSFYDIDLSNNVDASDE